MKQSERSESEKRRKKVKKEKTLRVTGFPGALARGVQRQQQEYEQAAGQQDDGQDDEQALPVRRAASPPCDRGGARHADRPLRPVVDRALKNGRGGAAASAVGHLNSQTRSFSFSVAASGKAKGIFEILLPGEDSRRARPPGRPIAISADRWAARRRCSKPAGTRCSSRPSYLPRGRSPSGRPL